MAWGATSSRAPWSERPVPREEVRPATTLPPKVKVIVTGAQLGLAPPPPPGSSLPSRGLFLPSQPGYRSASSMSWVGVRVWGVEREPKMCKTAVQFGVRHLRPDPDSSWVALIRGR